MDIQPKKFANAFKIIALLIYLVDSSMMTSLIGALIACLGFLLFILLVIGFWYFHKNQATKRSKRYTLLLFFSGI